MKTSNSVARNVVKIRNRNFKNKIMNGRGESYLVVPELIFQYIQSLHSHSCWLHHSPSEVSTLAADTIR